MKKLLIIGCSMFMHQAIHSQERTILLCPLELLDETSTLHEQATIQVTINDALYTLSRILQNVIAVSAQPNNTLHTSMRIAAIITALMEKTSRTAAEHNLAGTDSVAQIYHCMLHDTKRPRPNKPARDDGTQDQDRERIRDVILASCINLLSNIAVITAHPHDHKLVASQGTLMAANILNAVKETVRKKTSELNPADIEQLATIITHACHVQK